MSQPTLAVAVPELADKLDAELTRIAQAQFETPEFQLLFSAPLTLERARFIALQFVLYNVNRRSCWAFVQARAPWDVKRIIWEHEQDELYHDPRGGADHRVLMAKEALALGATEEDVETAQPTPLLHVAQLSFIQIAEHQHWLGSLTSSHFLERRNNSDLMKGGGFSARWRTRCVDELGIDPKELISSNVHVEAEIAHSDSIWAAIAAHVVDEETYNIALRGAKACTLVDRAYRAALAHGMATI